MRTMLLEPVTVIEPDPINPKVEREVVKLRRSEHDHELEQAWFLKNWDGFGVGRGLEPFVAGLARIGSFDLTGMEVENVQKPDGTTVRDPVDNILTGHASATNTLEYIYQRILNVDLYQIRDWLQRDIEPKAMIYLQYFDIIRERNLARLYQIGSTLDKMKRERDGYTAVNSINDPEFLAIQEQLDKDSLEVVKKLIQSLSEWKNPPESVEATSP